jgi:hypothetical protein
VQDWLRRSPCLLSDLGCTAIDAGVPGCMRLGMRLSRSGDTERAPVMGEQIRLEVGTIISGRGR